MNLSAGLALLPCAVVVAAVVLFRSTGLQAAGLALVAAAIVFVSGGTGVPGGGVLAAAIVDAAVLTVLVAATVVPGVLFVETARRAKADQAIIELVDGLHLPKPQLAILVALGLGVAVESLTGMGVSLLVTVPLLVRLLPRPAAIALALIGMSLMPYGALSLGPIVGAKLGGIPADDFARLLWRVSGPVAAVLPLIAVIAVGGFAIRDATRPIVAGFVLCASIGVTSAAIGMELAGVAGGLAVLALTAVWAEKSIDFGNRLKSAGLVPYAVLIAAVVLQKFAVPMVRSLGFDPALATERVRFQVLSSPGLALLAATLILQRFSVDRPLIDAVARRCWRALAATAMFMLTARLLVSIGAIEALAQSVAGLGFKGALVATALLGAAGGFVTGSGVSGNALFLPGAAMTGALFGARDLFAVVSNSAAGHTAMASLPVVAILVAALPERTHADERIALRIGFLLAAIYVAIVIGAGLALV